MLNKEQTQDDICEKCGKECTLEGKTWKQVCNACRKRKTSIQEKSAISHDNKSFIHIKREKVSINCDQNILNKEQTQDDICEKCGKECTLEDKLWKQVCNACRKRKSSDLRNENKKRREKHLTIVQSINHPIPATWIGMSC